MKTIAAIIGAGFGLLLLMWNDALRTKTAERELDQQMSLEEWNQQLSQDRIEELQQRFQGSL